MKTRSFFFALLLSASLHAQDKEKEQYIHRGLFRAMGTIATGSMFSQSVTNIYLHGNIEYYISNNVSLRGDGFYFVSTMGDVKPFAFTHSVLSGASYHFKTKSHFDPYLGFAPGVSITKMGSPYIICDPGPCTGGTYDPQTTADPLLSSVLGFNLYFQKIFHLFMETRYVYGRHLSNNAPESLSELRFSFGLGLNFGLIKRKV